MNMMSNGGSEEVQVEHSLEDASLSGDMKPDFFSGSTMAILQEDGKFVVHGASHRHIFTEIICTESI
jgi:hypothetical protein